jgi:hypothetical protein
MEKGVSPSVTESASGAPADSLGCVRALLNPQKSERILRAMRKAALRLITLAVGICIGIFANPIVVTDIDGEKTVIVLIDTSDSLRIDPVGTGIDGQKMVVLTDTSDSLRLDPK